MHSKEGSKVQSSLYYANQQAFYDQYGEEEESKAYSRRETAQLGRRNTNQQSSSMARESRKHAFKEEKMFNNLNISRDRSEQSVRMSKNLKQGAKLDRENLIQSIIEESDQGE